MLELPSKTPIAGGALPVFSTRLRLLLGLAALLLASPSAAAVPVVSTRNVQLFGNFNDYPPTSGSPFGAGYASCWGYIHPDGREYALIGTSDGMAIYNVTDIQNIHFVALIPGIHSA